jgi:hypothetical protein
LLAVIHGDGGHHTASVGFARSCVDAEAVVLQDRTARNEARDAFDTVISLAPIYCERLHHTKKDYHESGEPCPVEARIKTLIQIIEGDA